MDHVADIKKYTKKVDEAVVASMEKTYRLVLSRADSALVSFADEKEVDTVRKNFIVKKLGVTDDAAAQKALDSVSAKMKGVSRKNRLTVYYLLAEELGKLDVLK
ncbi:MAG: DUF2853 family protein [Propionibacteriaceae bacterium]|nr:DUF2853 family protein [Propionibacteriaceae bacterium]